MEYLHGQSRTVRALILIPAMSYGPSAPPGFPMKFQIRYRLVPFGTIWYALVYANCLSSVMPSGNWSDFGQKRSDSVPTPHSIPYSALWVPHFPWSLQPNGSRRRLRTLRRVASAPVLRYFREAAAATRKCGSPLQACAAAASPLEIADLSRGSIALQRAIARFNCLIQKIIL